MKRKGVLVLIIIMLLFNMSSMVVFASGSGDEVELVPGVNITGTNEVQADKFSVTRYQFDSEKFGITDVIPKAFKGLTDLIFFFVLWGAKFVNYALVEAFTLNIFSFIENVFDSLLHAVRDAVYTPLLSTVLPITGLVIVFNAVTGKIQRGLSLFIQTLAILVIAAAFMNSPTFVINMVNDMSESVSNSALSGTATVATGQRTTGNDAIVNLSNIYWNTAIMQPWQIIEFGKVVDPSKAEEYLSKAPGSDARKDLVEADDYVTFGEGGQTIRVGIVLFLLLVNIVMGAMLLLLAGLMFVTQFAAIFAAVMAVLGFIISLLPNQGLKVAIHAVYNVFEFLLTRLAITILLCMYFAVASVLYSTTAWFIGMILQLALIVTAVIYRKKIFSFVKASAKGSAATKSAMDRNAVKDFAIGKAKTAAYAYGAMRIGRDVANVHEKRKDRKLTKRYQPTAEKYLYKRYDEERRSAERIAKETGEPVEYSDFVKQTDARVERGFVPFSESEIKSTTEYMKSLHRQGEDPDRLAMTTVSGKTDEQIRNDQTNLEYRIMSSKMDLKETEDFNEKTYDRVIRTDPNSEFYESRRAFVERTKAAGRSASRAVGKVFTPTGTEDSFDSAVNQPVQTVAREQNVSEEVSPRISYEGAAGSHLVDHQQPTEQPQVAAARPTADGTIPQETVERTINEHHAPERSVTNIVNETVNKEIAGNETQVNETHSVQNVTENVKKENVTRNTQETVNNKTTHERNEVINASNVVNTETKQVQNNVSNVVNQSNEVTEKVINQTSNTQNNQHTHNVERSEEPQREQPVTSRRNFADKLDRINKKEES